MSLVQAKFEGELLQLEHIARGDGGKLSWIEEQRRKKLIGFRRSELEGDLRKGRELATAVSPELAARGARSHPGLCRAAAYAGDDAATDTAHIAAAGD